MEAEERFKKQNERLDQQLAFQKDMKSILSDKQFEKFQKISHLKKKEMKEKMAKRRKMKFRKEMREIEGGDK